MGAFIDGWHVLQLHSLEVLAVTACILWGGVFVLWLLGRNHAAVSSPADRISLVAASWMLPGLLFSAFCLLAQRWFGAERAGLFLAALAALAALPIAAKLARNSSPLLLKDAAGAGLMVGALMALVLLRLAFAQDLLLPQYFDSAAHYGLIRQYQQWADRIIPGHGILLPVAPYYHVGYHVLIAGIAGLTQLDIGSLMLVSGQLILALTPVALFALAHRLSGSPVAAGMGVVLAAAGWYMPAFAANWGKYPALFGLSATIAALTIRLMAFESVDDAGARRRLWVLSLLMIVTAGLLHTRSIVVVAAAAAAGVVSRRLWRLPPVARSISVGLFFLAVLAMVWWILAMPALSPVFDPYVGAGLLPTLTVCMLGVFAFRHRPQTSLAISLFIAFLLAGLIIPAPLAGFGSVLDRPFVEMWVFAPLSLLGAVGFAGLTPYLGSIGSKAAAVILTGALLAHAIGAYEAKASSCCAIVARDDMIALDWLGANVRAENLVAIATESLQLGPGSYQTLEAPVDAGAWVNPLTGLGVVPLPHDVDLGSQVLLEDLCRRGVRYVYLGGSGRSFVAEPMQERPARFTTRLRLPGASVLEILNCG